MNIKVVPGLFAAAICLFFGLIFALASTEAPVRLATSAIFLAVGFGILTASYLLFRKPPEIVHRVEFSGDIKAAPLKCVNCGGSISPRSIKIISGAPYATCSYCGSTFEVVEEPKW